MVRTQVYITERERATLARLSSQQGKTLAQLVREAIDSYIARCEDEHRRDVIDRLAGIWKERDDIPDLGALRREWDREGKG